MTWLNWSLKFHTRLCTSSYLIHTQYTSLIFNECLFHLYDCTCSNVMCVCLTICGSSQENFCSFWLLLAVICIPHVFQVFQIAFVWKTYFLGVFVTHFMCKLSWELNGPILTLHREFHGYFMTISWVRLTSEIPAKFCGMLTSENFQISF